MEIITTLLILISAMLLVTYATYLTLFTDRKKTKIKKIIDAETSRKITIETIDKRSFETLMDSINTLIQSESERGRFELSMIYNADYQWGNIKDYHSQIKQDLSNRGYKTKIVDGRFIISW